MADETGPELTPEQQRAVMLEKIREVLRYAVEETEDGPTLDLDLLCRLLTQRSVPYRLMNRELMAGELGIVRAEQDVQRVRSNDDGDDTEYGREAQRRLETLRAREKQILDLLWPI